MRAWKNAEKQAGMGGKSVTFTEQSAQLPDLKRLRPEYRAIYSQVLQDVLHRLGEAPHGL